MTTARVFVNGAGVDCPADATVLDALAAVSPEVADQVRAGTHTLVDSRGLPIAPDTRVFAGAIVRTVRARDAAPPPLT